MIWVGTGMLPSNRKQDGRDAINYVAGSTGLLTTTPSDASVGEMVAGDLATARLFGERIAQVAKRFA